LSLYLLTFPLSAYAVKLDRYTDVKYTSPPMTTETEREPQMGLTFEKVWAMFQERFKPKEW
jgi:hypothetical protein